MPPILLTLPQQLPPQHTQIKPRCFTCSHFKMCAYKSDYLKTAALIQNCLGAPQHDYELTTHYITIPGFTGLPIINEDQYLPEEINFDNSENKGKLWLAKFDGINTVNIVYRDKEYYILLHLKYDKTSELYQLEFCHEAFYGVEYEVNSSSLEEIQVGLIDWREYIINAPCPAPPPKKDVINTTFFSATLDCEGYDPLRGLSFEQGVRQLMDIYPNGIPIDEDGRILYHIATFHIEDDIVPYAPLYIIEKDRNECYIPPKPPIVPKPPVRRGDM